MGAVMMGHQEIEPEQFQRLLETGRQGHQSSIDQLWEMLYEQLYSIARIRMRGESSEHTFSTVDLIHEAYLKLAQSRVISVENRMHFLGIASRAMRQVLIDHARKNRRHKRHGKQFATSLDKCEIPADHHSEDLLELDTALDKLSEIDERLSQIVEFRFFGGMTIEETASLLNVSTMTIKRDWNKAKAWLYKELQEE